MFVGTAFSDRVRPSISSRRPDLLCTSELPTTFLRGMRWTQLTETCVRVFVCGSNPSGPVAGTIIVRPLANLTIPAVGLAPTAVLQITTGGSLVLSGPIRGFTTGGIMGATLSLAGRVDINGTVPSGAITSDVRLINSSNTVVTFGPNADGSPSYIVLPSLQFRGARSQASVVIAPKANVVIPSIDYTLDLRVKNDGTLSVGSIGQIAGSLIGTGDWFLAKGSIPVGRSLQYDSTGTLNLAAPFHINGTLNQLRGTVTGAITVIGAGGIFTSNAACSAVFDTVLGAFGTVGTFSGKIKNCENCALVFNGGVTTADAEIIQTQGGSIIVNTMCQFGATVNWTAAIGGVPLFRLNGGTLTPSFSLNSLNLIGTLQLDEGKWDLGPRGTEVLQNVRMIAGPAANFELKVNSTYPVDLVLPRLGSLYGTIFADGSIAVVRLGSPPTGMNGVATLKLISATTITNVVLNITLKGALTIYGRAADHNNAVTGNITTTTIDLATLRLQDMRITNEFRFRGGTNTQTYLTGIVTVDNIGWSAEEPIRWSTGGGVHFQGIEVHFYGKTILPYANPWVGQNFIHENSPTTFPFVQCSDSTEIYSDSDLTFEEDTSYLAGTIMAPRGLSLGLTGYLGTNGVWVYGSGTSGLLYLHGKLQGPTQLYADYVRVTSRFQGESNAVNGLKIALGHNSVIDSPRTFPLGKELSMSLGGVCFNND